LAQAHVVSQATQQPFQIDWHLHAQPLIPAVHTICNNDDTGEGAGTSGMSSQGNNDHRRMLPQGK
ncbi:hypothetical protein Tco_0043421, partial [Tanacetum coccineum]